MTLCCLGIGWPLAKRLSPTMGQNCTIVQLKIQETQEILTFLKREFLNIFLIHLRQFFIIEMQMVFKIKVLLLSLLFVEIIRQFSGLFYFIFSIRACMAEEPPRGSYAIKYVHMCMYVYYQHNCNVMYIRSYTHALCTIQL